MTKAQLLVEKYLNLAQKDIILEGLVERKAKLISYIKKLLAAGVDKEKINNIVNFYKFSLDSSDYDLINEETYEEIYNKLIDLAKEAKIIPTTK